MNTEEVMAKEEEEPDLMNPYKNFLFRRVLPPDESEAQRLKWKASYCVIHDSELFKREFTTPLLKCLNSQQVDYVMKELHEGICDLHTGGRSLGTKVVRAGYYWPTLKADALDFTKKCRRCQEFIDVLCTPSDYLHNLSSP